MTSPQERRGDRIPAHRPCTGMGSCGDSPHSFPRNPVPPQTLPHPGRRPHQTAGSFRELFLRVQGRAPGGNATSALWTGGQGAAVPLGPEAQDRPAFCPEPSSEWRMHDCPCRPSCLLSCQASLSPHRERATLVLPPARCSCHGSLSRFVTISRQ